MVTRVACEGVAASLRLPVGSYPCHLSPCIVAAGLILFWSPNLPEVSCEGKSKNFSARNQFTKLPCYPG